MIKTVFGITEIKVNSTMLMADLTIIISTINRSFSEAFGAEESKELLEMAFRDGMKDKPSEPVNPAEMLDKLFKSLGGGLDE